MSEFAYHLDVVADSLFEASGFGGLADAVEVLDLLFEVFFNLAYRLLLCVFAGHEKIGGIDAIVAELCRALHGGGVELLYTFYLIVPKGDPHDCVGIGEPYVDGVADDAYVASSEGDVIACVQGGDEAA